MPLTRRAVLGTSAAAVIVGVAARPSVAQKLPDDPFTLGVASGDPRPGGVTLWTRLAPDPLVPGFGMTDRDVMVNWQIATDERMTDVVRAGSHRARAASAHSVHVDVRGLEPDRHYWYRFRAGPHTSTIGRTRTFPEPGVAPSSLRFATLSCQNFPAGYFTALGHLAQQDVDVVLHLGDYIYESRGPLDPPPGPDRLHLPGRRLRTLEDYRIRHAQYRLDPDLQAAHAAHPFIAVPDDHEVTNNMHVDTSPELRQHGYQTFWEHLPLPASSRPNGPSMSLYRGLDYGTLATFAMLDTRQYRTPQLGGPTFQPLPEEAFDPTRTLTGAEQERWLFDRLATSPASWSLLGQQVYLAALDMDPGEDTAFNTDKWDGYPVARERLTRFLHQTRPPNPVSLGGDVHAAMVNDITLTNDPDSPLVASEFLGSSVTSPKGNNGRFEAARAGNPQMRFYNGRQRGYLLCEVTPERFSGELHFVDDVTVPDSPVRHQATYVVEAGRLGAVEG